MARLWTCGFELQSAAAGVEILSVTGTPSISTSVHRLGAASLRINPTAATQYVEQQVDTGVVKRTLHRLYLRITTLPSATVTVYAIGQSGYFPAQLRLSTSGTLRLYDAFNGTDLGTASTPLTVGQWYRIELDHTDAAGTAGSVTGAFVGYLDGTNFSGSTLVSNINGFSRIRAGFVTAATGEIHLDDLAVNDTTGAAQTGLPGAGNVVHLVPDAAGDNNLWATAVGGTAGTANNWGRVSDAPPNDSTSYNETTATGTTTIDDFNLSASATAGIGATDPIRLVAVGGRIGSNAVTAASIVYRLKSQAAGTVVESASVSVALSGWATHKAAMPFVHQLTAYTNPQSGAAWTRSALDTAQIGVRSNVSQTTARRVSALWALVEFVGPSSAAAGTTGETSSAQPLARRKTRALGTAVETTAAQSVGGRGFDTLTDDFNDNAADPIRWPDSYEPGGYSETGGRARVLCTTAYNAYSSAAGYRLRESRIHCRVYPPAAGGATTEAWVQVLVQTTTLGTDAVFEISAITGNLVMASRTGYFDSGQVAIPYNPVAHAWLRLRETGGNLYWDTSPDGTTWTNRRTTTAPAWVGDKNLQVQLIAHRDGGTADFAEFDNFNTAASQQLALTAAASSVTAQQLGRAKTMLLVRAADTAVVQLLARTKRRPLICAAGTDGAQPLTRAKQLALGTAIETSSAQPLACGKRRPLTAVAGTSTARALARSSSLTRAQQTDTARLLGLAKTTVQGTAGMVETARSLGRAKVAGLGVAAETAEGRPLTSGQTRALVPAEETWTARLLSRTRSRALPAATATDTSRPLTATKALALGPSSETASTRSLTATKRRTLPGAQETSQAQPFTVPDRITPAEENSTARPLGLGKASALVGAADTAGARPLAPGKARVLGTAVETVAGLVLHRGKRATAGMAVESVAAAAFGSVARAQLGTAHEETRALIGPYVRLPPAAELSAAQALAGERQRPADQLDATTSGPDLAAAYSGPALTPASSSAQLAASTSGPHLTTTTGG